MTTKTTPQRKRMNATKRADALFSKLIRERDQRCRAAGYKLGCSTLLQCAHVVSRRYRSVRWDGDNAVALCAAHHVWFTHHPLEWEDWCWSSGVDIPSVRYKALNGPTEKAVDALVRLRALSEEI